MFSLDKKKGFLFLIWDLPRKDGLRNVLGQNGNILSQRGLSFPLRFSFLHWRHLYWFVASQSLPPSFVVLRCVLNSTTILQLCIAAFELKRRNNHSQPIVNAQLRTYCLFQRHKLHLHCRRRRVPESCTLVCISLFVSVLNP